MFRLCLFLLVGVLAMPGHARLMIGLWEVQKRDKYMVYESIPLMVSLENIAPDTLTLQSPSGAWLDFIVKSKDGRTVTKEYRLQLDPLQLKSKDVKNVQVDLTPLFSIRSPGRYEVRAVVKAHGKPQMISRPLYINVDIGRVLWKKQRPHADATLTYNLIAFNPTRFSTRLYLQVEDIEGNRVLATQSLGNHTQVLSPTAYFDDAEQLHVLHTIGMSTYGYNRMSPTGEMLNYQVFESEPENPPRLRKHPDGSVLVVGGFLKDKDDGRPTLAESQGMGEGEAPTENITNMREQRAAPISNSELANPDADSNTVTFEEYLKEGGQSLSAGQESAAEGQSSQAESSGSESSSGNANNGSESRSSHQRAGTKGR